MSFRIICTACYLCQGSNQAIQFMNCFRYVLNQKQHSSTFSRTINNLNVQKYRPIQLPSSYETKFQRKLQQKRGLLRLLPY